VNWLDLLSWFLWFLFWLCLGVALGRCKRRDPWDVSREARWRGWKK
jgi:hypothetical protein